MKVPLVRPWTGEEEDAAVHRVLASGTLVKGPEIAAFETELAAATGRAYAVTMNSGTSALWAALRALGVGPGGRVVVPDLTFPATANAVQLCGAEAVLCDVRADSWNLDPRALEACLAGGGVTAVMPVDQFGLPADWAEIAALARRAGAAVLEDAACALGAERGAERPGARAAAAVLSFHPRKPITTGEGGAVLTDDPDVAARCRTFRDHGLAGGRFTEAAGNLRFAELPAAVGRAQLARLPEIVRRRRRWAALYRELLAGAPVRFQETDAGAVHPYQTFAVELVVGDRDAVLGALRERGVEATVASFALHRIPHLWPGAGRATGAGAGGAGDALFPVAARLADRALALPLFPQMTEGDVRHVATALRAALGAP